MGFCLTTPSTYSRYGFTSGSARYSASGMRLPSYAEGPSPSYTRAAGRGCRIAMCSVYQPMVRAIPIRAEPRGRLLLASNLEEVIVERAARLLHERLGE